MYIFGYGIYIRMNTSWCIERYLEHCATLIHSLSGGRIQNYMYPLYPFNKKEENITIPFMAFPLWPTKLELTVHKMIPGTVNAAHGNHRTKVQNFTSLRQNSLTGSSLKVYWQSLSQHPKTTLKKKIEHSVGGYRPEHTITSLHI